MKNLALCALFIVAAFGPILYLIATDEAVLQRALVIFAVIGLFACFWWFKNLGKSPPTQ